MTVKIVKGSCTPPPLPTSIRIFKIAEVFFRVFVIVVFVLFRFLFLFFFFCLSSCHFLDRSAPPSPSTFKNVATCLLSTEIHVIYIIFLFKLIKIITHIIGRVIFLRYWLSNVRCMCTVHCRRSVINRVFFYNINHICPHFVQFQYWFANMKSNNVLSNDNIKKTFLKHLWCAVKACMIYRIS